MFACSGSKRGFGTKDPSLKALIRAAVPLNTLFR
jgi:hypothetical protein